MPHEPQRLASTYSKSTSKQTIRLRQLETQYESQLLLINQTQLQQAKINSLHEVGPLLLGHWSMNARQRHQKLAQAV